MPRAPKEPTERVGAGASARGRKRGGGAATTTRRAPPKPYERPKYTPEQQVYFDTTTSFDETRLDKLGLQCVELGPDFSVTDTHIAAISSRPILRTCLATLSLGDANTGCGGQLSNEVVIALVQGCPNLRVLILDACTRLNDETFMTICRSCPRLEVLRFTGNDRGSGYLTEKALKQLKDSPELVPNLRSLVIFNQAVHKETAYTQLTKARPKLTLETGEIPRDGPYVSSRETTFKYRKGKMLMPNLEAMFGKGIARMLSRRR